MKMPFAHTLVSVLAVSFIAGCSPWGNAAREHDVRAYGAVGDGKALDTAAIQKALDACAGTGGRVVVPAGEYRIGTLFLGDDTELHLAAGAVLKGSADLADYNASDAYPQNFGSKREGWSDKHFLVIHEKRNVKITGSGVIDGNAPAFFDDKPQFTGKVCWRQGAYNAKDRANAGRPGQGLAFVESTNLEVRGITLRNMTAWSCFFHGCENVTVGNVTVSNNLTHLNTDGFDIDSCRNVRIGDCTITTGDDAIAVRGAPARLKDPTRACERVRVSNVVCRVSADGVRVGVGNGAIRDVEIANMRILSAGRGLHVQNCYGGSGKGVDISDVRFRDIEIVESAEAVMVAAGRGVPTAVLTNIAFTGVKATAYLPTVIAGGGATRPQGVVFSDCSFRLTKAPNGLVNDGEASEKGLKTPLNAAFRIEDSAAVAFRNVSLDWDADVALELNRPFALADAEPPEIDGTCRGLYLPGRDVRKIAAGWDLLTVSVTDILREAEAFDRSGLDGVMFAMRGIPTVTGKMTHYEVFMDSDAWDAKGLEAKFLPPLKEMTKHPGLRQSQPVIYMIPRKRAAWRDDARWNAMTQSLAAVASLVKKAGLDSIAIDPEDYHRQKQFRLQPADGTFDEIYPVVRRRGRQYADALFGTYPELKLLVYWLYSFEREKFEMSEAEIQAEIRAKGDLWPAFVDGLLEGVSADGTLYDGNENTYWCDSAPQAKRTHAKYYEGMRASLIKAAAPELRGKYRRHVRASYASYLDMYTMSNKKPDGKPNWWYFGPVDGSRVKHLDINLAASARYSEGFLWIYGERGSFVDWHGVKTLKTEAATNAVWSVSLPGFTDMIRKLNK